MVFLFLNKLLG